MNKQTKKLYKPSSNGRFGKFGGKFVPETLMSSKKKLKMLLMKYLKTNLFGMN